MHNDTAVGQEMVSFSELKAIGIVFGVAMCGFAAFWVIFALALTAHGARVGMTFSLSWWSLVFPVGATALGLSALAETTGSRGLEIGSLCMYVVLVAIWSFVACGSVVRGDLAWWR